MGKRKIVLCDSNIIIEIFKGNEKIINEIIQIGEENLGITVITMAELYYGAINKNELKTIITTLKQHTIYHLDKKVSRTFVNLMQIYSISHKLRIADAIIASIAIENNLELYTLDKKDFNFIPELKLYKTKF